MSGPARARQGAEAKALTIDEIMQRKRPQVQTVYIMLDPSLEEDLAALQKQLRKAEAHDQLHNERDTAPAIKEKIREVEQRIAETRIPFKFQSMGRKAYGILVDEWPPREGVKDDEDAGFNQDEFPPRLIALSSMEPEISLEKARTIWAEWSDAEATKLLSAAFLANREVVDVPFTSDGIAMETLTTGEESSTPTTTDSLTQSS